jgi:hypothetical protein
MRRLVQVVADYGPGELAFAELLQRLAVAVPDGVVNATVVDPGDTLAAGLCVAQLALADGPPGWIVVHDVGAGQRLLLGVSRRGALIVGPDAGWSWSFVVDELRDLFFLDVPGRPTGRPARDLVPLGVRHAVTRHPHAVSASVPRNCVPALPACAIAWIHRSGDLETTLSRPPAAVGERVRVDIGEARATAIVADDRLAVPEGELALAPGSLGWPTRDGDRRRLLGLGVRGGSAAERFDNPPAGAPVLLAPVQPRAAAQPVS